jgi:hypothetical protein
MRLRESDLKGATFIIALRQLQENVIIILTAFNSGISS